MGDKIILTKDQLRDLLRAAYMIGWGASGEGFNEEREKQLNRLMEEVSSGS